jgi:hypothetical protein
MTDWIQRRPKNLEINSDVATFWFPVKFERLFIKDRYQRLFIILTYSGDFEIWERQKESKDSSIQDPSYRLNGKHKCISTHESLRAAKAAYLVIASSRGLGEHNG